MIEQLLTPASISVVGFPIVMCILLWHSSQKALKENTKAIQELSVAIQAGICVYGQPRR
jgi:hypothetical protein